MEGFRLMSRALRAQAVVLGTLLAAAPVPLAQSPDQAEAAIRVDVVVSGLDGAPVRGLTRDDFDLLVAGQPRTISAFREVDAAPPAVPAASLPADLLREVATNTLGRDPRVVIFVLADRSDALTRAAAVAMLDSLDPAVPVGVAFTSGGPGVELTFDRVRLRAVLDTEPASPRTMAVADWQGLLPAVEALADRDRLRRAFVVLGRDPVAPEAATEDAWLAASREAGVAVYHYTGFEPADSSGAIDTLVRETGGRRLTGSPERAAAALLSDLEHHYLLSVAARPGEDVGRLADIAVAVRRDDVVVRPRLGHHDGPLPARAPGADALSRPMAGVVPAPGVELRAVATPFPSGGGDVPVVLSFEMTVPRAPLEERDPLLADEVEWRLQAIDVVTGRVTERRGTDDVVALRPRGTSAARHDVLQYELESWIDLRPGRYQLRVAATSAALDVGGSVFLSTDVPAPASLSIGGVVFGFPAAERTVDGTPVFVEGTVLDSEMRRRLGGSSNALTVVPGARGQRIPIRPAIGRRFDRWDELKLYFEIDRRDARATAAATVEIVDVLDRVVHRADPAVERDRTRVMVDVPLVSFVPGAYRVRVVVDAGEGPAVRETGFVVNGVPPTPEELAEMTPAALVPEVPPTPDPEPPTPVAEVPPPDAEGPVRISPNLSAADRLRSLDEANRLATEGWERYQQGDVEGAQERLARSIALGNDSAQVHYALGLAEFALGRHLQAVEAFEFSRQRRPDYEPVYFDIADAFIVLGRLDDALAVLRDAAGRWPENPEIFNATGQVLFNRGDIDEAIEALERATVVAPKDGLGFFNLAQAYRGRMMRWEAERSVQMRTAARALADRDRQRAIEAYTTALELGGSFNEWDAREALRVLSGGLSAASR